MCILCLRYIHFVLRLVLCCIHFLGQTLLISLIALVQSLIIATDKQTLLDDINETTNTKMTGGFKGEDISVFPCSYSYMIIAVKETASCYVTFPCTTHSNTLLVSFIAVVQSLMIATDKTNKTYTSVLIVVSCLVSALVAVGGVSFSDV